MKVPSICLLPIAFLFLTANATAQNATARHATVLDDSSPSTTEQSSTAPSANQPNTLGQGIAQQPIAKQAPPESDKTTQGTADDERFTTDRESPVKLPLPEEDDSFVFAVFGDRTGGPADGVKILAQAVTDVNLVGPDLVMTVGDLVQGYNQTRDWQKQANEFSGIMDELTCPWYPVAGNHDVYWRGEGRPANEHEGNYERHFGPLWYAFRHKDCWFITLYTDEGDPKTGKRTFKEPASQRMSDAQLAFLDKTLERTADARHVFVFLHHPRWRAGGYGDDWERVHERLAKAGNVTAVFAGHIHHMVYDGVRDGIEYFTLATVGGATPNDAAQAGYLHHWNLVTVRNGELAVSTFPVGAALDPRLVTDEIARSARTLIDKMQPEFIELPSLAFDQELDAPIRMEFKNPLERPIELSISLDCKDGRWTLLPDHLHTRIESGETKQLTFHAWRPQGGFDGALGVPQAVLQFDYLAESHRVSLPARRIDLPIRPVGFPASPKVLAKRAMAFDGQDDCLVIPHAELDLHDGPFTVECWFRANSFKDRQGLLNKTENSEYGYFLNNGVPAFYVHLSGSYASVKPEGIVLDTGRWYQIAAVFDGEELRLYLDGKQCAQTPAKGKRTLREIPLLIGADTDDQGRGNSFFDGLIDEVRVSNVARYQGQTFTPTRNNEPDQATRLLLHMDQRVGSWAHDSALGGRLYKTRGNPQLVPWRE